MVLFLDLLERSVPPACLLDPSFGSHQYITANGIKFHCVSSGDPSKPLMLLLHGFPEVTTPKLCVVATSSVVIEHVFLFM